MTSSFLRKSLIANPLDSPRGSWWVSDNRVHVKCALCGHCFEVPVGLTSASAEVSLTCPQELCSWSMVATLVNDNVQKTQF